MIILRNACQLGGIVSVRQVEILIELLLNRFHALGNLQQVITIKTKTMPKAKTNKKDKDKDIDTYIDKETERMIDIDLDKNKDNV